MHTNLIYNNFLLVQFILLALKCSFLVYFPLCDIGIVKVLDHLQNLNENRLSSEIRLMDQKSLLMNIVFVFLQLALKHRQGRNHKMRIVVFVGSPIEEDEKEVSACCDSSVIVLCSYVCTMG